MEVWLFMLRIKIVSYLLCFFVSIINSVGPIGLTGYATGRFSLRRREKYKSKIKPKNNICLE